MPIFTKSTHILFGQNKYRNIMCYLREDDLCDITTLLVLCW